MWQNLVCAALHLGKWEAGWEEQLSLNSSVVRRQGTLVTVLEVGLLRLTPGASIGSFLVLPLTLVMPMLFLLVTELLRLHQVPLVTWFGSLSGASQRTSLATSSRVSYGKREPLRLLHFSTFEPCSLLGESPCCRHHYQWCWCRSLCWCKCLCVAVLVWSQSNHPRCSMSSNTFFPQNALHPGSNFSNRLERKWTVEWTVVVAGTV